MITITAPGKLMLSGEWSVLELGNPCIVMAVDAFVSASIKESEIISINAPDLNVKAEFEFKDNALTPTQVLSEEENKKLLFSVNAIKLALQYLSEKKIPLKTFALETNSKATIAKLPNGEEKKLGFGSSAAITVAITGAILAFHDYALEEKSTKDLVYKLSTLAHYFAQGKLGSGFDIAASTYGGLLYYVSSDKEWLVKEIEQGKSLHDVIDSDWKHLVTEPLPFPIGFQLSIGFVGYSASTTALVTNMKQFKASNLEEYDRIYDAIGELTHLLAEAIKDNESLEILFLLRKNRVLLQELAFHSRNNLETDELKLLADLAEQLHASGKFSGAGGGDMGIAVYFDEDLKPQIEAAWKAHGITPLNVSLSFAGVTRKEQS